VSKELEFLYEKLEQKIANEMAYCLFIAERNLRSEFEEWCNEKKYKDYQNEKHGNPSAN